MFMHGPGGHRHFTEKERAENSWTVIRRLLGYFKPYAAVVAFILGLLVFTSLLEIAGPYLSQVAIDQFILPAEEQAGAAAAERPAWLNILAPEGQVTLIGGLTRVMIVLLLIYVIRWLSMVGQQYMMMVVGQKVLMAMRTQILARVHTLSLKFFDENEAGDLMSRLVNDTQVINQVFSGGIMRLLGFSLNLVAIVVAMFVYQWDFALVSLAMLPVILFTTSVFAQRARTAFRRTRETIGDVSAELQENISGVREVQAFARERENVAEFRQVNRANRDANVQAQTLTSAFGPTFDVLSTVALALVLGYGGWSAMRGAVTVGVVFAFVSYVQRFYRPIGMISNLWTQFQSALAGAERIFDLLDTQPVVVDAPDAVVLPLIEGRVVFEDVSFHYVPEEPVLHDVDLVAEPGQTVALVGPTGAGKTSVVSLLIRFYDVIEGRITIDGYDLRDVTQASLRSQMGMVLQDTFLFSGTVMDNIRYGRLEATDEEVYAAAEMANAHEFITRLPEGYQTNIGERGSNLSQGQRQLVSIARAILADPRILILDEATSSVDTRTELLIQRALEKLLHGRTSFVIAHRLSTIRNADQVLVIDHGEIVERGTHTSLMAERGRYYELYMSQFRRETESQEEQPAPAGMPLRGDGLQPAT